MGIKKYLFRNPHIAELSWSLREYFTPAKSLEKQLELLREQLRNCPDWTRGHERLGNNSLTAVEKVSRAEIPRLLATVELCSQAIEVLNSEPSSQRTRNPGADRILRSAAMFYQQNHAESLELTEQLLAEYQGNLSEVLQRKLFEQAGGSAMALGMKEKAKHYFGAIPEKHRSPEALAALNYVSGEADSSEASSEYKNTSGN